MLSIGIKAPDFTLKGVSRGKVSDYSRQDYKGKWLVLFFYPADFTFICPTEVSGFSKLPYLAAEGLLKALNQEGLAREQSHSVVKVLLRQQQAFLRTFQEKSSASDQQKSTGPFRQPWSWRFRSSLGLLCRLCHICCLRGERRCMFRSRSRVSCSSV
jgi:hypothetical protein